MATLQLNHIARETSDVARLAAFYEAVLGFERIPSPTYSGFQVAWLRLPSSPDVALHLIERDPAAAPVAVGPGAEGAPPSQLPRRHHLAFSVADYDGFVTGLKARGTDVFEKSQPDGRTRQVFFFDPDGERRPARFCGDQARSQSPHPVLPFLFIKINEKTGPCLLQLARELQLFKNSQLRKF
jgi:catechol 2,3-dioxygenase-like lactoylglutathione lyase family enzyme